MGIDALLDTLERSDVVKLLRAIDAEEPGPFYGFVPSPNPDRCCAEIAGDLVYAMYSLPSGVDWHEWAPDLGTIERVRLSDDGRALLRLLDALKEATEDA